jgi:hypothetical protein
MNFAIGGELASRPLQSRQRRGSGDQALSIWWLLGLAAVAAVAWTAGVTLLQWITLD